MNTPFNHAQRAVWGAATQARTGTVSFCDSGLAGAARALAARGLLERVETGKAKPKRARRRGAYRVVSREVYRVVR